MSFEDERDEALRQDERDEALRTCDLERLAEAESRGLQHDAGKVPLHLLPFDALEIVAEVFDHGRRAGGYSDHNWSKGLSFARCGASLLRHMFAWMRGVDLDPKSGKPHIAHVAARALMLTALVVRKRTDCDDRHVPDRAEAKAPVAVCSGICTYIDRRGRRCALHAEHYGPHRLY